MDTKKRVKELCREQGMTQKALAERLGVSEIGLNSLLRRNDPHISTLEKMAAAFGITLAEFLDDTGQDETHQDTTEAFSLVCPKCRCRISLSPTVKD